jgi:predicted NBD/HSP70 family sugar kinase
MATVDKLIVRIEADLKDLKRGLKASERATKNTTTKMKTAFAGIRGSVGRVSGAIFSLKGAIVGLGAGAGLRSLINVGNEVESLQIRFKTLFGSAEEGAKAFDAMAEFAGKVPFSLQQIQAGSGSLLAVADDAEELGELLKMTGTIAAATGLDFRTASEQIQRSLSAGIGAADLFRDRGVTAMLGFKAGTQVTVKETREALEQFAKDNDGITDELANTFAGTLSMIGDTIFTFQRTINDAGFFGSLTRRFQRIKATLDNNKEATEELAQAVSDRLIKAMDALEGAVKFVARNFDELVLAMKALIALKLGSMIFPAITGAITLMNIALVASTGAMTKFNIATKLNPFFLIGGGAILAITAIVNMMKEANAELDEFSDKIIELDAKELEKAREKFQKLQKQLTMLREKAENAFDPSAFAPGIDDLEKRIANMRENIGPGLEFFGDTDIDVPFQKVVEEVMNMEVPLTKAEKLLSDQLTIVHRILDAHKQERAEMKMTEAELMLHNLLKDESVELTSEQLQRVKDTIQATLDLNKELEIQKAILAQNASEANSVFQALSKSSQIEKDSPAGVPDPKGTAEGSPLKKFLDPEGHGSLEDEARLLEELGILTKNYRQEQLLLDQALANSRITQEQYNEAIGALNIKLMEASPQISIFMEGLDRTMDSLAQTMADSLMGMGEGWKGFRDSLKGIIRDIIAQLIKLQMQQMMTKAFGMGGGGGGSLGNIFSSISGFFGGGGSGGSSYSGYGVRANGGAVTGNSPYMVGEQGPELFVPHTSGGIFTNRSTKQNAGGGVNIQQVINIETGVSQTVRAEMASLLPQIKQESVNAVMDAKKRGGQMADTFS